MSIAYSDCDERKLVNNTCQQEYNAFNVCILTINNNISRTFDTTSPSATCRKVGHTFRGCEDLKFSVAIQKSYLQLCVVLQKIKGMGARKNHDTNSLRFLTIYYVNSILLLPPQQPVASQDAVLLTSMDRPKHTMQSLWLLLTKQIKK